MENKDFVLEIGTEELPSSVVKGIPKYALKFQGAEQHIYVTPRRIIIYIKDSPPFYEKTEVGPPKRIAYDADGNPTKALLGFLKKINANEKDISKVPQKDNDKVQVQVKLSINNVMNAYLINFIKCLELFQTMAWDESGVRFPRPIRWILALHGSEIIPININGVTASNITYGHRLFSADAIEIKDARDFFNKLKKFKIIYDFKERKDKIEEHLKRRHWHKNPQLLDEVTGLVEYPEFLEGVYDRKYLRLPKEALIASMSKNQRVFPLEDSGGNFINKFIAVTNGNRKNRRRIKRHYEQVLNAQLKDALFFYNEDLKKSLPERTRQLEGVIFHKKLGTYADKIERLKKLAAHFKETFRLTDPEYEKIVKACELCKADLLTQMVGEFPSLQGVMGKYYALVEGIDKEIAQAVEEHYRPRSYEDKLPETKLGTILALLDKFDSVICHFKAGHQPQGNRDLYALRRQAIGIINIILNSKIELSLSDMFDKVFEISPGNADKKKLKDEFIEFIKGRLIVIMGLKFPKHDLLNAVLSSGFDNIYRFYLRLNALNNIIAEFYFEQARCVVERTNNITKNVSGFIKEIDISLLQMQEEKELHEKYKSIQDKIKAFIQQDKYDEATKLYGNALADITNSFFDKVMVNVEDEKLKNNRLKLLKEINNLYVNNIADLSKIRK